MKLTPEKIIEVISGRDGRSMSSRELLTVFNLPSGARRILQRQLRELERQGLLRRVRGGRYALVESRKVLEGVLSLNRRGDGMIQLPDSDMVRISNRFLGGAGSGDRVRFALLQRDRMNRLNGKVLTVIERSLKRVVGSYQRGRDEDFILPVDASFSQPIMVDRQKNAGIEPGDWVVVEPLPGDNDARTVRGKLIERLGSPSDPAVEMQAVACRFSIPLHFSPEVNNEAGQVDEEVHADEIAIRQDLRQLPFVTIDGETARDFDDAVTISHEGDLFRLYVAIADVSHYVLPDSAIDQSAFERGTSVYFPGYCIPMLPEALSNEICSLKPGVDRLVMVAELLFNQKGERQKSSFYPGVIRSRARMTYHEVQDYLNRDDGTLSSHTDEHIRQLGPMLTLSAQLTRLRMQRGSLDFEIPEPEVVLDSNGRPETFQCSDRLDSQRIIEEFMLAANEAVAGFLCDHNRDFPYRIHEPPESTAFTVLNHYLAANSLNQLNFNHDLHPDMQKLINSVEGAAQRKIVSRMLLQSMKQARYSVENEGHYGLAAEKYCHFTSPIRRYPDLLVHRILKQVLLDEKAAPGKKRLIEMAEQSSRRERVAVNAERDVMAMLSCRFMEERIGKIYSGTVSSVQKFGLFVELDEIPVEGLIHIAKLEGDYFRFDADRGRLVGERTGQIFTIGLSVKISVENVNIARREIDFNLASNPGMVKKRPPVRRRGRRQK